MKILLIGNGRMGKEIAQLALHLGHTIVFTIDNEGEWAAYDAQENKAEVAIEFTLPDAAVANIQQCFNRKLPLVCGTTGWHARLNEVTQECHNKNQSLIYASNFSPGMNIVFEINRQLARMMNNFMNYDIHIEETHHIHKLDSPSGTAVSLAEDILGILDRKSHWSDVQGSGTDSLMINSHRSGEVTGDHEVIYESDADRIVVKHEAKNRKGFALGAILAASWIINQKGVFTMKDMIQQLSKA